MKIRHFIYRIVLLLFISTTVFAQSTVKILGVVTSKNTREPIPGVNIVVVGTGYGAASDINGRYQIENLLEGIYTIRAYFIGCKIAEKTDVRVPIDNSVRLNFQLEQHVIPLAAVEIAANRFDIGPDVSKITLKAEAIAKSNAGSVGELLTEIPGVDIKTTGSAGTKTTISIRGSQSNQVLVLLDGIPLNNEQGGDADLASIPANIIEKIDVYKGGQSSRYGSGAIGGVIHIQTKSNFKNQLQLNSGAGAFGYFNIEPAWSGSYRQLTWFLSYQYSKSDGDYAYSYQDSKNESVTEERLNADFDSHNFYGRLNFQTGDHRFSIHGQQLLSDRGIPGAINGWTPYASATAATSIAGAEYQYTRRTMNVTASYRFSNAFSEYKNHIPVDAELKYRRYPAYSYDYETRNNIISTTLNWLPKKWFEQSVGYTGRRLNYREENKMAFFSNPVTNADDMAHGVFLQQTWQRGFSHPVSQLRLTPAIRFDEMNMQSGGMERHEQQWSPGINAFASVGEDSKIYLKGSYTNSFRAPTFADLFYQEARVQGKPDLRPEKSINREFSVGFQLGLRGQLTGEATAFNYNITDLIVWRLGNFEVFQPFNADADITGQEYLLNFMGPGDWLEMDLSYTHLAALNKNDAITVYDKFIPYKPEHTIKGRLGLDFQKWHATITCRNVSQSFVTEANTKSIPGYTVFDWTLNRNIKIQSIDVKFKFSIYNLLDEHYEIIRDYPLPPREWRIGAGISY